MKLEAPDLLKEDGFIKKEYTADGANVSPKLKWSEAPKDTKSFAIYVHDPDAPGTDWIHWIVINIPKHVKGLEKKNEKIGVELINDFGTTNYGGPAPPSGTHRYYFTVYALSVKELKNVNKTNFLEEVEKVKLDQSTIVGKYSRA